ncbi:MAG: protein SCO1/2, partial [Candidatus Azotimanducaceae bacterium]
MSKKKSYLGLSVIVLIFAVIFIPRIHDRIVNGNTVDNNRSSDPSKTFEAPKVRSAGDMTIFSEVPSFTFINQNSDTITNANYKNKVYVVEFFFSTCPSICPIMNVNMEKVQDAFAK